MGFFNKHDNSSELQGKVDKLMQEKELLTQEISDYRKTISAFVDVRTQYEADIDNLKDSHKVSIETMKQSIESEKKSVARRVNQELSKIGIKQPFVAEEISPEATTLSPDMVTERWMSMPESQEKHDYFKKHEKLISKSVKK